MAANAVNCTSTYRHPLDVHPRIACIPSTDQKIRLRARRSFSFPLPSCHPVAPRARCSEPGLRAVVPSRRTSSSKKASKVRLARSPRTVHPSRVFVWGCRKYKAGSWKIDEIWKHIEFRTEIDCDFRDLRCCNGLECGTILSDGKRKRTGQ